jgi:hypothetical protein
MERSSAISRERAAERARVLANEAIERTRVDTRDMLRQYRQQKGTRSIESKRMAFRLDSTEDDIRVMVEKKRDKGGGLLKKRPEEKLAYVRLLQLPCIFFEHQYLKKKGLFGSKVPHRSSAVFSAYEWPPVFRPELNKDVTENNLVELKEGYMVPMDEGQAEERAATHLATAKNAINPQSLQEYKKGLNLDSDPKDIQALQNVNIVYLPMWVAKLETPATTRYLAYDCRGKEHDGMAKKLNTDHSFALELERNARKL